MNDKKPTKLPKALEHLLEKRDGDRRAGKDRRSGTTTRVANDRRKSSRRQTARRKKA